MLTSEGGNGVVTGGLQPGDRIITSGFQKTGPGAPVTVVPDQPPAGADADAAAPPDAAPEDAAPDAPETDAAAQGN